jgi:hypothetical protein
MLDGASQDRGNLLLEGFGISFFRSYTFVLPNKRAATAVAG